MTSLLGAVVAVRLAGEPLKLAQRSCNAAERTQVERPASFLLDLPVRELSVDPVEEAASKPLDTRRVHKCAVPPDGDGLIGFAGPVHGQHGDVTVCAGIESMNGARFVHDWLEELCRTV